MTLSLDLPLEELEISIRSFITLRNLKIETLGDLTKLSAIGIMTSKDGTMKTVREIESMLAANGLSLSMPSEQERDAVPTTDELVVPSTFGGLHIFRQRPDNLRHLVEDKSHVAPADIRNVVIESYRSLGLSVVDPQLLMEQGLLTEDDYLSETDQPSGPEFDSCLVLQETSPWWAVLSNHWECMPPGKNPLALALSAQFPVLSVTCIKDTSAAYVLYQDGAATHITIMGKPAEEIPTNMPQFEPSWLDDKEIAFHPRNLSAWMTMPDRFMALCGFIHGGYRDFTHGLTLTDFSADDVLFFQRLG